MRKTTLALATLAMLTTGDALAWSSLDEPIRASTIEEDRDNPSGNVRFLDTIPEYGHAGRIQANEDLYRQQVQEAQGARMRGQMMQMDRDLSRARALERESLEARRDYYRSRIEDRPRRSAPPPRRPLPPPPPPPPKSSTAPQNLYAPGREPPPPPRPPR